MAELEENDEPDGSGNEATHDEPVLDNRDQEMAELRRRLVDTPRQISRLESKIRDANRELTRANARNQKLNTTLETARERITALRDEVEKLSQPPSAYGTVVQLNDDGTADVHSGGRKMRVAVHQEAAEGLRPGQEVVLNEAMSVVMAMILAAKATFPLIALTITKLAAAVGLAKKRNSRPS